MRTGNKGHTHGPESEGHAEAHLLARLDQPFADALGHPVRRAILGYLSGRPKGADSAELVNASHGVDLPKVIYHCKVLEQHGLVAMAALEGASGVGYTSVVTDNSSVIALLEITEGRDAYKLEP